MVLAVRVAHGGNGGMVGDGVGEACGTAALFFDAQLQGFQALEHDPGVKRRCRRAHMA